MSALDPRPGAAPLADLHSLPAWEAAFVQDMRRWIPQRSGPSDLDRFLTAVHAAASRPLVRHNVGHTAVSADECVVLHMVRTASGGDIADAALIAALMARPAFAEQIALLAGVAGSAARQHRPPTTTPFPAHLARRLI